MRKADKELVTRRRAERADVRKAQEASGVEDSTRSPTGRSEKFRRLLVKAFGAKEAERMILEAPDLGVEMLQAVNIFVLGSMANVMASSKRYKTALRTHRDEKGKALSHEESARRILEVDINECKAINRLAVTALSVSRCYLREDLDDATEGFEIRKDRTWQGDPAVTDDEAAEHASDGDTTDATH